MEFLQETNREIQIISNYRTQVATGKKIGFYVRSQYGVHRAFRVERTGKGFITGSYLLEGPIRPERLTIQDIHFTYPPDGDFHQTVNFKNGEKLRVFHERAYRKREDGPWLETAYETVNASYRFLMKQKKPDFHEFKTNSETFRNIVAVGFGDCAFKGMTSDKPKNPAVIIDATDNEDSTFTINFMLAAKKWDFTAWDERSRVLARFIDESEKPFVYLVLEESLKQM